MRERARKLADGWQLRNPDAVDKVYRLLDAEESIMAMSHGTPAATPEISAHTTRDGLVPEPAAAASMEVRMRLERYGRRATSQCNVAIPA